MSDKTNSKKRVSKFTDDQLKRALTITNGIQSEAAKILNIHRSVVCERVAANPEIKKLCEQLIEDRIDRAEQALDRLLKDNNTTAVIFTLKTLGHRRGWIERAPMEDVDTGKLKTLSDFFSSISSKPRTIVQAPEAPIASTVDEPISPDLSRVKTSLKATNFP